MLDTSLFLWASCGNCAINSNREVSQSKGGSKVVFMCKHGENKVSLIGLSVRMKAQNCREHTKSKEFSGNLQPSKEFTRRGLLGLHLLKLRNIIVQPNSVGLIGGEGLCYF